MAQLRLSAIDGDDQGAVYYGMGSTARRSSKDIDNKRESIINDDLADEIEAIRLAADFTSRRLLNEQKREGGSAASSSRQRIRALLDKQKTQRVCFSGIQKYGCEYNSILGGRGKSTAGKEGISRCNKISLGLQINVEFKRFMSKYKKNSFIDPKQKRENNFSAIYLNNAIYEKK